MTLQDSVTVCFTRYADFTGRATRSEYWWFVLFVVLVTGALAIFSDAATSLFSLLVLVPSIAVATRRLHDTNRSGWWQLIVLVPAVGLVILIVFLAQDGRAAVASPVVTGA